MSDSIASLAVVADSTYGHGQHPNAGPGAEDRPESEPDCSKIPDPSDLRLVIEGDSEDHAPVYKVLDAQTGRVVQTLGRDELLHMREARNYVAGQVIKTRA